MNDILIQDYKGITDAKTFMFFGDWKKQGCNAKAKETSFRIWGSPIKGIVPTGVGYASGAWKMLKRARKSGAEIRANN